MILLSSYPKGSSYKEKKEKKRLELKLHFSELPFLNFSVRSEEKVTWNDFAIFLLPSPVGINYQNAQFAA